MSFSIRSLDCAGLVVGLLGKRDRGDERRGRGGGLGFDCD